MISTQKERRINKVFKDIFGSEFGACFAEIFLTVVACETGRNSYLAGTDQRAGSGVWLELWVIGCTNSDPLEI